MEGWGQAYHTVGEYFRIASEASQLEKTEFQIQIELRPDSVDPPWQRWDYAHVEVQAIEGPEEFLREFRRLLAANSQPIIPPGQIG